MFYQLFSLIVLAFHQLHAVDYCSALVVSAGVDYCDGDLFCMSDGSGGCERDENADISGSPFVGTCTGCTRIQRSYNGVTYYVQYSQIRDSYLALNNCSLDYYYNHDVLGTDICDTTNCVTIGFGVDDYGQSMNGCFDYCWANPNDTACYCPANPTDPTCYCFLNPTDHTCFCLANPTDPTCFCLANPADPTCQNCTSSSTVCCAVRDSYSCSTYCVKDGTQSTCCGGPSTYETINTASCANYAQRYASDLADVTRCKNDPTNYTACAMCSSYYQCCSQYKNVTISGYICDSFCALKPSDEGCKSRKKCIDSLGSSPTDVDYAACGTSVVRLSSICVALLLGLVGFFVGL